MWITHSMKREKKLNIPEITFAQIILSLLKNSTLYHSSTFLDGIEPVWILRSYLHMSLLNVFKFISSFLRRLYEIIVYSNVSRSTMCWVWSMPRRLVLWWNVFLSGNTSKKSLSCTVVIFFWHCCCRLGFWRDARKVSSNSLHGTTLTEMIIGSSCIGGIWTRCVFNFVVKGSFRIYWKKVLAF